MADDPQSADGANRRAVGVYDRPEGADRLRTKRVWMIVVVVAIAIAAAVLLATRG